MTEDSIKKGKKLLWCDECKSNKCYGGYADGKPGYCRAAASRILWRPLRRRI